MAGKTRPAASPLDRFPRAVPAATPRLIGCSAGEVGTGKSDFWLSAPGPLVYFDFNQGLEGVVDRHLALNPDKEIRVMQYPWEPVGEAGVEGITLTQEQTVELRDQIVADFEHACANARSVVVDEYELWEMFRYAEFGGPSDRPNNYSSLNQRYRKFVNTAKKHTCNLGFVQSLKDEWVSITDNAGKEKGRASGRRKIAGWKELNGMMNVELFHTRSKGQFTVEIGKVRGVNIVGVTDTEHNVLTAKGETMFSFKELGMMVWPNSTDEDWE